MKAKIVLFVFSNTRGVPKMLRRIQASDMEAEVVYDARAPKEVVRACRGADAVFTILTPFPKEVIEALDSTVRAIVVAAMGYDHVDVAAAEKRGIIVSNVPDYAVQEVAVHQMALMLSALRKINIYNRIVHEGRWTEPDFVSGYPVHRLSSLTYGLLGFGKISRLVAKYTLAFGMRVIAYDPFIPKDFMEEAGVICAKDAYEVFQSADIISPNVPLADELRYMIDEQAIDAMKDGVIIVNTGRGALIRESALIEGLKKGRIGAAALDVFETEPFCDRNNPLMEMENVILTPHIAYQTEESEKEVMERAIDAVILAAGGKEPADVVKLKEHRI